MIPLTPPKSAADWLAFCYLLNSVAICIAMLAAAEFLDGLAFLAGSLLGPAAGGFAEQLGRGRNLGATWLRAGALLLGVLTILWADIRVHLYGLDISAAWWVPIGCLAAAGARFSHQY